MIRPNNPPIFRLFTRFLTLALIAASTTALQAARTCNPRDFGAKADGTTKDTAAIQSAIDACATKDGGTVQLTAGTYLSAPIVLKSNITLKLDKGATLLGSPDHADYPAKIEFRLPAAQGLVSATNAENVAITGEGTIDGQGESWWNMIRGVHDAGVMGNPHPRPRLVVFPRRGRRGGNDGPAKITAVIPSGPRPAAHGDPERSVDACNPIRGQGRSS